MTAPKQTQMVVALDLNATVLLDSIACKFNNVVRRRRAAYFEPWNEAN
ncbi:MAG: hypothetical protein AB8B82_09825 [Roseovarius sp.]